MTKIVAISDTHGLHRHLKIPKCDLLIHCGDFTGVGRPEEIAQFKEWLLHLLDEGAAEKIVIIPGNHDLLFEANEEMARKIMSDPRIHVLIEQSVELFGLKIFGSPYTPTFFDWAFMRNESTLFYHWKKIPDDADIVITHGAPWGHLDSISRPPGHAGSQTLLDRILEVMPKYHLFGHLHMDGGRIKELYMGEEGERVITLINAACLDDYYKIRKNVPVVFDV